MNESIRFDSTFVARPVTEQDRELIGFWIMNDPDHCGRVDVDFFMTNTDKSNCLAVEDGFGIVVFYLRLTIENGSLIFDIQFGIDDTRHRQVITMCALEAGCKWFKKAASGLGLNNIRFESSNAPLQKFAERRLGFERDGHTLTYAIGAEDGEQAQEKALRR